MFLEQPLALPESAKYGKNNIFQLKLKLIGESEIKSTGQKRLNYLPHTNDLFKKKNIIITAPSAPPWGYSISHPVHTSQYFLRFNL